MVGHHVKRFSYAWQGLLVGSTKDMHVALCVFSIIPLALFGYVVRPLSLVELGFLALAYTLVLITELQNSALERALDRLHPERHEEIGIAKDMSAAAVLVAGIFALGVVATIVIVRL